MDSVKEMVLSICAVSLVIGIVNTIKPSGKFDRQLGIITACLMLAGVLAPVYDGLQNIDDYTDTSQAEENAAALAGAADEEVVRMAEEELETALKRSLADKGIPSSRLEVEMNTCDDTSIDISSVTVVSTRHDEAETELRSLLGEEVKIYASSNY